MHMTFQQVPSHERPNLHEEPLLEDKLEEGKEPFTPEAEAPVEGFATAEQIKEASMGAAEKGFADMEQIDRVKADIARMQYAGDEKIKEVTGGRSEQGFATPEQINAVTTVALDQASNSMETTGRTNARIAMEEAEDKLAPKPKGIKALMNNILGLGAKKRQDSQDRFGKVN